MNIAIRLLDCPHCLLILDEHNDYVVISSDAFDTQYEMHYWLDPAGPPLRPALR